MDWYGNEDDEEALQRLISKPRWLEAIRGELTLAELAAQHGVHHTMIASCQRQAIDGMASSFAGVGNATRTVSEGDVEKLHAKFGQLMVKRDFFSKSLRSLSADRRWAMVEPAHHSLLISAQCRLLSINHSFYYLAPDRKRTRR